MTAADSGGPDLHAGDTGDAVLQLQTRLHALGLFTGSLDGRFGDDTGLAVDQLREHAGLMAPGYVDADAWAALAAAERASGSAAPAAVAEEHWQWDGESWQPAVEAAAASGPDPDAPVDATGQWMWDGTQWQPIADERGR
jgi:peptidoglycan hydrolase-like protein with peptidoglycan-binding domain